MRETTGGVCRSSETRLYVRSLHAVRGILQLILGLLCSKTRAQSQDESSKKTGHAQTKTENISTCWRTHHSATRRSA